MKVYLDSQTIEWVVVLDERHIGASWFMPWAFLKAWLVKVIDQ